VAQKGDYSEIRTLVRLASKNPTQGYDGIHGALAHLGDSLADATVGSPLKEHGIEPAPGRKR
jgi:putative transposase